MCNACKLQIPGTSQYIEDGSRLKLGRFDTDRWIARHGWYTWGGNRPVCGWYLTDLDGGNIKPLQKTDLDDIYLVERG